MLDCFGRSFLIVVLSSQAGPGESRGALRPLPALGCFSKRLPKPWPFLSWTGTSLSMPGLFRLGGVRISSGSRWVAKAIVNGLTEVPWTVGRWGFQQLRRSVGIIFLKHLLLWQRTWPS